MCMLTLRLNHVIVERKYNGNEVAAIHQQEDLLLLLHFLH